MKGSLITLLILTFPYVLFAQTGIIRGTVTDSATGEPLVGVTVQVEGTSTGTITDFDGKFELTVAEGVHTLAISYVSFSPIRIEDTRVDAGRVTVLDNIRLTESVGQLQEVIITAEAIRTSEEALLTVKRRSANLLDGISAANFSRIGDSDAASAVKRVPGVSIEGGRYVFVRGLGDRYTKSTLNGMDVPGLDPDRNTLQMDLFPTSIIDNIVILKSFTADLPGDFTGGIVDINTKDFPGEKTITASIGLGYNPSMHFNSNYLTYEGGKTDFLGVDDGTRAIPTGMSTNTPLYADVVGRPGSEPGREFRKILEGFNPTLSAMRATSFMDYSLGLGIGNQITTGNNTWGYTLAISYANNTEYYRNAAYGRYGKGTANENELQVREYQAGEYGANSVMLSGIAGLALKRESAKYRINVLHIQNGESRAGIFQYENSDLGANFLANQHNLEYNQRSLTNLLLGGDHYVNENRWHIGWKISPTRSSIEDPDIRYTRYRIDGDNLSIGTESGYPERIWRYLEETSLAARVDVTHERPLFGNSAKIHFGSMYTRKNREYNIQNFQIIPQGVTLTGDPNELFRPENLWPMNASGTRGTRYAPLFIPFNPNAFESGSVTTAGYVSVEFNVGKRLRTIAGLRAEQFELRYSGVNQQGLELNSEIVLDDLNFFPSVNVIYSPGDSQNLRFSYARTIARPSFKEASYAEILDPLTGRTFIGSFFRDVAPSGEVVWDGNLRATDIDNLDLRWEAFQESGQTLAASVFYKRLNNPIEMVQYVQAPNNFQPRNVGDGVVYGVELEARQRLSFLSPSLDNFSVNANVTIARSRVDMSVTEYNSRVRNAREDEVVSPTRQMAGQAPYIVNAGVFYTGKMNGLEAGLYYNVQGETLTYVGIADKPDVFSLPFHSVNFSATRHFGKDERLQVGVNVSNLLAARREYVFRSFRATDKLFSSVSPGTSFSVKVGYSF
ncbi:MAG TPA: TonB-dependent receptor [Cyclobacteriaceae bacterium]